MAIVWVHEALTSGEGVAEHDVGSKYTRMFDVLTNSYDDNADTVGTADDGSLAIPSAYAYFSKGNDTNYGSVVSRISPTRDQRFPLLWHVRVEYTVIRANTSDGTWPGGTLTITSRMPTIRIWGIPVAEVLNEDINGDPIVNSAGQPYEPLPEDVYYLKAFEIVSWIRTYNLDTWETYEDSTNADTIWGREPGTLLMIGPPNATRKVDDYGTYYEARLEIHYNPKGWKKRLADMGTAKLATATGDPPSASTPATGTIPITDNAGVQVRQNVPLDGNGQPLGRDTGGLPKPLIIKEWTIKQPQPWAPLNLPVLNIVW